MRTLAFLTLLIASGCASVATQQPARPIAEGVEQPSPASLFPSDSAVLDDAEIGRILRTQVRLPAHVRVALLHVDHRSAGRYYGWYSHVLGRTATPKVELNPSLVETLRSSSKIQDASYLPDFLVPEKPTVGHLREAAARYQSDLLFLFKSDCQLYDRYRFLRADEAKAYCIVDSAVLDTRTGIVPFTSRSRQDVTLEQQRSDAEFAETLRNAEVAALDQAMQENAENLVRFLGGSLDSASQ
jgi:hypothetical protein